MTSIIPGQEEKFLKRRDEEMKSEYDKIHINIDNLDHVPSPEEIKKINEFNLQTWRELGGNGIPPE